MDWSVIKPDVFGTIMDFFATGLPVLDQDAEPSPDTSRQRKSRFVYFLTSIRNDYSLSYKTTILKQRTK